MVNENPLLRYKIRNKIGSGGMASVYRAVDKTLNRDVAIKMVHPHLLHQPETMRRFTNEAQAIASVSHDHIVKIFDYGIGKRPFIVMEYIDGTTLSELLAQENRLPPLLTIEIALQVLSALAAVHAQGIFHRDVKPANILIDKKGSVHVADFGIAYLVNAESVTLTGALVGSPHYISPEQIKGGQVSGKSDIYALGILLYQCISGIHPFASDNPHGVINLILSGKYLPLGSIQHGGIVTFAHVVDSFLEHDPSLRPDAQTAISRIKEILTCEKIVMDEAPVKKFTENAISYRDWESKSLFETYLHNAKVAVNQKKRMAALKAFGQAAFFGEFSPDDAKLESRLLRQSNMSGIQARYIAGILAMFVICLIAVCYIASRKSLADKNDKVGVPEAVAGRNQVEQMSSSAQVVRSSLPLKEKQAMVSADSSDDSFHDVDKKKSMPMVSGETLLHYEKMKEGGRKDDSAEASLKTEKKEPGYLICYTNPPWSMLTVDHIERGETPVVNPVQLAFGEHVFKITRQGYLDSAGSVQVFSAETTLLRIKLRSDTGAANTR